MSCEIKDKHDNGMGLSRFESSEFLETHSAVHVNSIAYMSGQSYADVHKYSQVPDAAVSHGSFRTRMNDFSPLKR